jgi:prephenate dehydrogenase
VLSAQALLMDVGSTKTDVVAAAMATLGERLPCFVPAHPIAGKEVAGVENADADLYQNRQLILTPLPSNGLRKIAQAHDVWEAIGSQVITLTTEQHDATFAAVSHLPHLVAFALINAIAQQPKGADFFSMAGPGFRDFSRIAASDPAVWRDILLANQDQLLLQSAHLRDSLQALEAALQTGDAAALQALIAKASATRAAWPHSNHDTD